MKKNSLWNKILPPLLSVMLAAGSVPWTVPAGAEEVTGDSDEAAMIAAAQAAAEEAARQEEESRAAQAAAEEAARVAAELERAQSEAAAAEAAAAAAQQAASSGTSNQDHSGNPDSSNGQTSGQNPEETAVEQGGETILEHAAKHRPDDHDPVLEELIFDEELEDASMELAEAQEYEDRLLALPGTGDWAEDLAAAALTQVGNTESMADFVVLENGRIGGYTLYGADRDAPYDPWCGSFVSYCLKRIGADDGVLGYSHPFGEWIPALEAKGLYKPAGSGYAPQKGDLVFMSLPAETAQETGRETVSFAPQGVADSLQGSSPNRVGIVTEIKDGKLVVVEGDVHDEVAVREYAPDDPGITGFVSMKAAQAAAGHHGEPATGLVHDEAHDAIHDDAQGDTHGEPNPGEGQQQAAGMGRTLAEDVNVRLKPGTGDDSTVLTVIPEIGTQLPVLSTVQDGDYLWYQVLVNGSEGYIRGDLFEAEMPEAVTEKVTEQPTEEVTEEATEEATEKVTEAVTEEPTEAPTEVPTEEATEAVTEEATEKSAEAVTEEVTEETTEAITEEITEDISESITEELTEEMTEAVSESITEELTEVTVSEYSAQPDQIEGVLVQVVPEDPEKIPAGSQMKVEVIRDEGITASAESKLEEDNQENLAVRSAVGLRLVFTDADGREFVPETKLYVKIRRPEETGLNEEETPS